MSPPPVDLKALAADIALHARQIAGIRMLVDQAVHDARTPEAQVGELKRAHQNLMGVMTLLDDVHGAVERTDWATRAREDAWTP